MDLRDYQSADLSRIQASWQSYRHVLYVLPTGGGKTVVVSNVIANNPGASCVIAHRQELVGQMSRTLGRFGIRHRIIAPDSVIGEIVSSHVREFGRSYYDANSQRAVAGVDTLARRCDPKWTERVSLWVTDEAHHLLRTNKWGKVIDLFPNARGLGVTATPERCDGKGLGDMADGVFQCLVVGPDQRTLINRGYLTDYRIFAPKSDIDLAGVTISDATGDYSGPLLREAARRSHITGDVVESYLRIAPGKRGITFCVSVELADDTAKRFRDAGVRAECVSAETPDSLRMEILRRFGAGDIQQLVNVDLFGEGFDVPAVECVSMARPTQSYGLYCQQFGRGLRPLAGKDHAIVIDHVGNVMRHGLPDAPRAWMLERPARRRRSTTTETETPIKVCAKCTAVYERFRLGCPYCGYQPEIIGRASPRQVDGDLLELAPDVLARLRGEAQQVLEMPLLPQGLPREAVRHQMALHRERVSAQHDLRGHIAWWAGLQRSRGFSDREIYRLFFTQYGMDVMTAQGLKAREAGELTARLRAALDEAGVRAAA